MSVEALGGLLTRVGNFQADRFATSFSERLILQKTVYLMQDGFGCSLGYSYNWYLHGPYSPSLARDAYPLAERYSQITPKRFKKPELEKQFERFLDFIRPHSRDETWLEIAASMLYLHRQGNPLDSILMTMHRKNPAFTADVCTEVWSELQSWGIVTD